MILGLLMRFWYIPVIALMGVYGTFWHHRATSVQEEYAQFKQNIVEAGKRQEVEVKASIARAEQETRDVQTKLVAALAYNKRLLNTRSNTSYLPAVPAGTRSPDTACFSRAELDGALSAFGTAVAGLITEGADATVSKDAWKNWYEEQRK